MAKISIIATFYNLESYLDKCLDSLINQTFEDIEIICLNDGSKDKTGEMLDKYAKNDTRVRVIHKENDGVSATRNLGLSLAKGDYIMFVDGDDYISKNTCEITYKKATETNADIVLFQIGRSGLNKNHFKDSKYYNELKGKTFNFFDKIQEFSESTDDFYMCDKLYKKEIIGEVKFPVGINFGEDSIFIIQILSKNPKLLIIEDKLYNVVERQGSLSRNTDIYNSITKYVNDYSGFVKKYFAENPNLPKLFQLHLLDRIGKTYTLLFDTLYFSKYKNEYKKNLKNYLDNYTPFDVQDYKNMQGYNKIKNCLRICNFHVAWLYWKIIRPVCKHLIVLPYIRIKKRIKNDN